MDNLIEVESKWEKRYFREREARRQAEKLLEEKSLALFEQNERLKNLTENLEKLVKQRTNELEEALENANQANLAKRDFFANISHELRTPLNGIIGMTHLLFDTNLNNIQKDFNHTILVSSEILLNLINDILDFSKIEAGKIELEQISFHLGETVYEILDVLSSKVNEKGLELYVEEGSGIPSNFIGDPIKLKQILINLASNAIKFTERGEVKIRLSLVSESEKTAEIKFEIIDTGIGISNEKISKLFSPFTQADASTNRKFGGTGLGLSISKKLVELMEGEIGIDSKPGCGSNFWFTAKFTKQDSSKVSYFENNPILINHEAHIFEENEGLAQTLKHHLDRWGISTQIHSKLEEIGSPQNSKNSLIFIGGVNESKLLETTNLQSILSNFEYSFFLSKEKSSKISSICRDLGFTQMLFKPTKFPYLFEELCAALRIEIHENQKEELSSPLTKLEGLENIRILLVEDNLINQKVGLAILNKMGCNAQVAGNGIIALQKMQEQEFDLIFMDYQMPELDGYETTIRIRNGHHGKSKPNIPIIAMTANAMKGDQEKCMEAGMNGFLSKPIIQKELQDTLQFWKKTIE
ncbi:MAG: ATP-binding protein [Bacteroidia bacterium]|nr:ATP-binding protein [Bacteroidia bacterium]